MANSLNGLQLGGFKNSLLGNRDTVITDASGNAIDTNKRYSYRRSPLWQH